MASLIRYEPFSVSSLWSPRLIDAWFDRFMESAFGRSTPMVERSSGLMANLYETDEAYWVEFPLPGVTPEAVQVTVQDNILTLRAKREWQPPANARTIWQGFTSGEWRRSFTLPGEVNADAVEATLEHGVLRLHLPKADHVRPRSIKVNAGNGRVNGSTPRTIESTATESAPASKAK